MTKCILVILAHLYMQIHWPELLGLDSNVKHVMNITDVDDKTIHRSQELYPNVEPKEALVKLTKDYEAKFKTDISKN